MGFSICWHLFLPGACDHEAVRERMNAFRGRCSRLPFDRVGPLRSLSGASLEQARLEGFIWGDMHFHLTVGDSGLGKPAPEEDYNGPLVSAPAEAVVEFVVWPGSGCETAHFVVARLPPDMSWSNPDRPGRGLQRIAVPRHSGRWYGFAGSKTQYAALPACGGIKHFLKCHLGLIAALEEARSVGFEVEVTDDGGYWLSRDPALLLRKLHERNRQVAGIVGKFKDAVEGKTDGLLLAPVASRPDFERLEAGGGDPPVPDYDDPVVSDLLRRTGAKRSNSG